MSSRPRGSSEYSSSFSSSMSSQQVHVSSTEKRYARRHLYKLLFKDWMAIVGALPALAFGVMPNIFVYLSADILNELTLWMTSVVKNIYSGGAVPIYDPMPGTEDQIKKMAGVVAAMAVCNFFMMLAWIRIGSRVMIKMKNGLFLNMMKSEVSFFDVNPIGGILTLLSEDAESVQLSFGRVKGMQIASISQGIVGVIMGLVRCWQVSLISLIPIPIIAAILMSIVPSIMRHSAMKFRYVSESMTIAEETLGAVRTVRGFNREDIETNRFVKATKKSSRHDAAISLLITVFFFCVLIVVSADMLADFYYGATFVRDDKLELGDLISVFCYTMLGSLAIVALQGTMQGEQKAIAAGARILKLSEHVSSVNFDGGETIEGFQGHIEFRNVSFKYPTRDAYVLKNVSFEIKPHQIGALVGHSGSGKSTCVQLLERYYDAEEGVVLLDGHDIKTLDPHWLHQKIALVSQEPVLFRTTVKENLKYGARDATDEQIDAAIEIANAKRVVEKLEKGLETIVGDKGSSLSGGQRQRIAIARAVVKNPVILITDEATSALDAQSEKKVQIALDKVMEHCTGVVVAHRLSTIRNAAIIYVFDAGEIKESGTHDELVRRGSYYYNLVKRQLTKGDEAEHAHVDVPLADAEEEDERLTESSSKPEEPKSDEEEGTQTSPAEPETPPVQASSDSSTAGDDQ